ncbi:MAG: protein translocase subunit SecF [Oscillospiraceae bacterium]|nr:protein translocase subunit SecF [Oscillospiraceae bacterium]
MINIKYVKNFKFSIILSVFLMAAGVVGLVLLPFGVSLFNLSIDFLGGTLMQYDLHTTMDTEKLGEISRMVEDITGESPTVQRSGDTGVMIKTVDIDTDTREAVQRALEAKYTVTLLTSENVSASVGADLRDSAIMSVIIASVLMLVYIAIRFEFKSGLAAVLGLIHDVLIMLSVYVIFQIPVDINIIATMLCILAYSINASIVLFDRIRENRRYMPKTEFAEIVDTSTNQTITRNINTTITTLLVLGMIIILGVQSIRDFAIPLAVGLAAGSFSSLFIVGPIWSSFRGKTKEKA